MKENIVIALYLFGVVMGMLCPFKATARLITLTILFIVVVSLLMF